MYMYILTGEKSGQFGLLTWNSFICHLANPVGAEEEGGEKGE